MATTNRDTLNQIVTQLEAIQQAHYQINSFGFGDIWEINTSGDINYPLMWVVHDGVDISQGVQNFKFNLIFCDIVKGGEVNENDVLSDQLEIAKDVIAQLKHPSYAWSESFVEGAINLEAFTERFTDSVAGYSLAISLELPYDANRCSIPTSDVSITSGRSASYGSAGTIYVYLDGVLQQTITSDNLNGETVNITLA